MSTTIQGVNSRQQFQDVCTNWCEKFLVDNKVLFVYVRRGPKPKQTINIKVDETDESGERVVRQITAVREGKRKPQGVIAAYRGGDDVVRVGWSLCRKTEPFHSKVGLKYALERAIPLNQLVEMFGTLELLTDQIERISDSSEPHLLDSLTQSRKDLIGCEDFPPQSVCKTLIRFLGRIQRTKVL
tara:strand:+ start:1515 stop:2069 length:555 start_codon:yes stop_codon:yes gene_type:complete